MSRAVAGSSLLFAASVEAGSSSALARRDLLDLLEDGVPSGVPESNRGVTGVIGVAGVEGLGLPCGVIGPDVRELCVDAIGVEGVAGVEAGVLGTAAAAAEFAAGVLGAESIAGSSTSKLLPLPPSFIGAGGKVRIVGA